MKFLVLFGLIGVALARLEVPVHLRAPAKILRDTCVEETNLSLDILEKSYDGELADDRALKCYFHCLFEKNSLYDANKNIILDQIFHLFTLEDKVKVEFYSSKCGTVHGADQCETAFTMIQCYFNVAPGNVMLP